jgi:hypothetical protein
VVVAKKIQSLFKSAVRYGGGGWGKNSGRLGVRIPAALCTAKIRDDLFVNAKLRVLISLDPETDIQPPIPGLEQEYPSIEIEVKVNQYSTNDSDVSFSMTFAAVDMDAAFLKVISNAPGSLYVLAVAAGEDGNAPVADEPDEEDEE